MGYEIRKYERKTAPSVSYFVHSSYVRIEVGLHELSRCVSICSTMEEKDGQDEREARIYELGYHIVSSVSEDAIGAEVTVLKDILAKEGASVIADWFPRLRPLAYPLSQMLGGKRVDFTSAYFGWVKFEAPAESAKTIESTFKKDERILRFILFKTVRESTLAAPRAPRASIPKTPPVIPRAPAVPVHAVVSETELEKSLEKIIAA